MKPKSWKVFDQGSTADPNMTFIPSGGTYMMGFDRGSIEGDFSVEPPKAGQEVRSGDPEDE